jgi:hypothetical protein
VSTPLDIERAVAAAMQSASPDDIIAGVKAIVADEVSDLNPDVTIEYTDYFNHTYMPDMVLKFAGRNSEFRPLYIRNSLRLNPTLEAVHTLEDREPVVLGLRPADSDSGEQVRSAARRSKRVLVTDISSLDSFNQSLSVPNAADAPLSSVIRDNLLRSGRGMMTRDDVAVLQGAVQDVVSLDAQTAASGIAQLDVLTADLYAEDGAFQIGRIGRILQASLSTASLQTLLSGSGRLSESDARVILPYLLGRQDLNASDPIWETLASLVQLEDLEGIREIEELSLNRLVNRTAFSSWTASRAELVLNNEYEFDSTQDSDAVGQTEWSLRGGKLTGAIGPWRMIVVSGDNRRLKGATDYRDVDWQDIATIARSMVIESASLRGVTRRLTIDAEESSNVAQDVSDVTATLEDSYRVQHLTVRLIASESPDSSVAVEFRKGLATVSGPRLALGELGTVCIRLLGYRYPVEPDWLVGGGLDTPSD